MELYPLIFGPIFKDRIWGGSKLQSCLNKAIPGATCGESWEISTVANNVSIVRDGAHAGQELTTLLHWYPEALLGRAVYRRFGAELPLLFKFIDARDDLSIQVHPDDALAGKRHDSFGKTEMWYVMQADQGARLIVGFRHPTNREQYLEHLASGKLIDLLEQTDVRAGDSFFLAPGTIHAIGGGILLAEIQQTSDITYRVYDWGRVDANGSPRELHIEQALDAINYNLVEAKCHYDEIVNASNRVAHCPYFITNFLPLDGNMPVVHEGNSFRVYICTDGEYRMKTSTEEYFFSRGDTVLVPGIITQFELSGKASLLEVYVPSD